MDKPHRLSGDVFVLCYCDLVVEHLPSPGWWTFNLFSFFGVRGLIIVALEAVDSDAATTQTSLVVVLPAKNNVCFVFDDWLVMSLLIQVLK